MPGRRRVACSALARDHEDPCSWRCRRPSGSCALEDEVALVVGLVEAADELGLRRAVVEPTRRRPSWTSAGPGSAALIACWPLRSTNWTMADGLLDRRALGRGEVDLRADLRLGLRSTVVSAACGRGAGGLLVVAAAAVRTMTSTTATAMAASAPPRAARRRGARRAGARGRGRGARRRAGRGGARRGSRRVGCGGAAASVGRGALGGQLGQRGRRRAARARGRRRAPTRGRRVEPSTKARVAAASLGVAAGPAASRRSRAGARRAGRPRRGPSASSAS